MILHSLSQTCIILTLQERCECEDVLADEAVRHFHQKTLLTSVLQDPILAGVRVSAIVLVHISLAARFLSTSPPFRGTSKLHSVNVTLLAEN